MNFGTRTEENCVGLCVAKFVAAAVAAPCCVVVVVVVVRKHRYYVSFRSSGCKYYRLRDCSLQQADCGNSVGAVLFSGVAAGVDLVHDFG